MMNVKNSKHDELFRFLQKSEEKILAYLNSSDAPDFFRPEDLQKSAWSYVLRPAKRLRPSVLLMACGSVGGDEDRAIPAAAGVEIFHTWTLVHDDLIDNDRLRRGSPTVHAAISRSSRDSLGFSSEKAEEYGRNIAILTGDMQHGWATTLFLDSALRCGVSPMVMASIVKYLQSYVLGNLIYGEILDVQYGMLDKLDVTEISEDAIVRMLWLKTGVLYEFAGLAGAMIGKETVNFDDPQVVAIKKFASNCGTAFQLQDDILGILGNEKEIGKPVGSDIREGKKTVIVYEAIKNARESQKAFILSVLGNKNASPNDVQEVTGLLQELGGIRRCQDLAKFYIEKAMPHLDALKASDYKQLLIAWADFMINRSF